MNVALVSEHASPLAALGGVDAGGQNVHVAALAAGLAARGHRVTVYTRRAAAGERRRVAMLPGVTVEHITAGPATEVPKDELLPHMAEFAHGLQGAWRRDRPDIVHAHFWMSGLASLDAAEPLGVPVVQTFHALGIVKRRHQGDADTSPPQRLEIEQRILRDADGIIATCSDEVFELLRIGANRRRVTVIPCGVDPAVFHPEGPAATRGREPRVLVLSRLVPRKGIDDVITAMADVPGAELVVAGGPDRDALAIDPEASRLRRLVRRLGLDRRVTFLGRVQRDAVPSLLRSADVVVSVPWYEPFGIVPLEAAACGVPVVASAVGGMTDTVVHELTGLHVPPKDPAAVAAAVSRLLADEHLRRRLGETAAGRAHERYRWDRVAMSTERAYAELPARTLTAAGAGR